MAFTSKDPGPEEKMEMLRKHWGEGVPLAELSKRFGIPVRDLDQWRRQLLERGERLFRDQAIPVGLKFEFEQFAAGACEEARMDGRDRALAARNLVNQLEQDWLSNIEAGLGTEAATQKVYETFGSLEQVAECLRQPIWLRLLFYQDYRPHRMLTVMVFTFLLGVSIHGTDFHRSQFYELSIVTTSSGLFHQFVELLTPLVAFLVPSIDKSVGEDGTRTSQYLVWMFHLKGLLGGFTLCLQGWQLLSTFLNVPFFLLAVDDWTVSLLQLLYLWLLGLAAVPALGCVAAEAFIRPGKSGERVRRHLLAFLDRCDTGRLFVGG